jgi:hypothetical protein
LRIIIRKEDQGMDTGGGDIKAMELTPFHMNIAKRFAAGERNRDILKEVKISASRLSILKGKPEFKAAVERYRGMQERAYERALEVFGAAAGRIAKELINLVIDPETPERVRLEAAEAILDRLAQAEMPEGIAENQDEEEVTFEQLLRITKRSKSAGDMGSQDLAWK